MSALKELVIAAVRKRWESPSLYQERLRTPERALDALCRTTLDVMLTRNFRISKLPPPEEYDQLLAKVRHWVSRGQPVRIMLGYSPMKNPINTPYSRADWAEFFAFCHLCAWHNKVAAVYPPGLRIKIVFDDTTARLANKTAQPQIDSYIGSIPKLIKAMGYESLLVGILRQSKFAWIFKLGFFQLAERKLAHWEQTPEAQPIIERMTDSARRNVFLPAGLSPDQMEREYRAAGHRYRVYWEALQLSGFSRLGKSLIGMYLDGSQHHIRQEAALHLASLGKEQVTQPWQGPGVLNDNGHCKLVPMVLTPGRRDKYQIEEVTGLNLVPLAGFDRMTVCLPRLEPAPVEMESRLERKA